MSQKYADIIIDISHEGVDRTFQYRIPPDLEQKVAVGTAVRIPFGKGNRLRMGYVIRISDQPDWDPEKIKAIREVPAESLPIEGKLIRLAAWMRKTCGCTMIAALKTVMPVKEKVAERKPRVDTERFVPVLQPVQTLNQTQTRILSDFAEEYDAGIRRTYLLHGVTGSGKTEVYAGMAEKVLAAGRDVIVLVPEIALTYQTVSRFESRFRGQISVLNSRLSRGEKYREFEKAKKGETRIMVGPRSALFAPFRNLGLIIIDEEHDPAYKSDKTPKYHARDTAIARAGLENASVVLGSATPSVGSFYKAQQGIYKLYTMPERAGEGTLAEVKIADMREELHMGNRSILSGALREEMENAFQRGEQVMLFINRRGYHSFVSCRSCGEVIRCPHCDVSLSLHRNGMLMCHYCGYTDPQPAACPKCGSKLIGGYGTGTEKVEEEVRRIFPGIRTLRMDRDTTRRKGSHGAIIQAFRNHEADCLVGTQMIVKGHDFENVTVVGSILADLGLFDGDYEAAERTFDLLTQAAGRAGRGREKGHVIIQTYQPEHYAITTAAKQDYTGFYRYEMAYRKMLRYPPVCQLLGILITSPDEILARQLSESTAEVLRKMPSAQFEVTGPADAAVYKISDVFRRVIYIKADSQEILEKLAEKISAAFQAETESRQREKDADIQFDFNPVRIQ